ncbi:MAG: c-type cytochrome [Zoogloeaceae bacterium]|jgi:cytochrome c|nr:c-type cytochrome [Zoogloeaceae bacterium]
MKNKLAIAAMLSAGLLVSASAQADEALAKAKNCTTCHAVDKKLIGPSYKDVAAKYTAKDVPMLVKKVLDGGSGVWGAVPMTPNKATVTEAEATKLVKWVLTLK